MTAAPPDTAAIITALERQIAASVECASQPPQRQLSAPQWATILIAAFLAGGLVAAGSLAFVRFIGAA